MKQSSSSASWLPFVRSEAVTAAVEVVATVVDGAVEEDVVVVVVDDTDVFRRRREVIDTEGGPRDANGCDSKLRRRVPRLCTCWIAQ
jgi:hypothetical protein